MTEALPFYTAFKLKLRNDILPNVSTTDSKTFEEKITLTKEIAEVLRKNIVQARRVENPLTQEQWRTFTCYPIGISAYFCLCRVADNKAH